MNLQVEPLALRAKFQIELASPREPFHLHLRPIDHTRR